MNGGGRDELGEKLPAWRVDLQRRLEEMSGDEHDRMSANALRSLDRATAARPLAADELVRLSALAGYLAPRVERRLGNRTDALAEGLLLGLMAGYQLAAGAAALEEPDPFAG